MKRTKIIGPILCAVAGVAIAWMLDSRTGPAASPGESRTSKADRRTPKDLRPALPPGVAAHVQRIRALDGTGPRMKAAYALAQSVPAAEIGTWLEDGFFETSDARVDTFFRQVLYDRILDTDPQAFLNLCLHQRYDVLITKRYMKEWMRRDPMAAREFLEGQANPENYRTILEPVMEELAVADRANALNMIASLDEQLGSHTWPLKKALLALAREDADELMEAAETWSEPLRKLATDEAVRASMQGDLLEGVAWVQKHTGSDALEVINGTIWLVGELRDQLLEHAAELPDGWADRLLDSHSWQLTRWNPETWLAEDTESLGVSEDTIRDLRNDALFHLAERNWMVAASRLQDDTSLSESERNTLVGHLATKLASRDRKAATAWMESLVDPTLREMAQAKINSVGPSHWRNSAATAPGAFIRDAANTETTADHYRTRCWTHSQTEEALQAFHKLEPAERSVAAESFLLNSHNLRFELRGAGVKHLVEFPPDPETGRTTRFRKDTVKEFSQYWAAADPAAAARWVETLPEGESRNQAAAIVLGTWRLQSPREAGRWLEHLPEGEGWDGLRSATP